MAPGRHFSHPRSNVRRTADAERKFHGSSRERTNAWIETLPPGERENAELLVELFDAVLIEGAEIA